MNDARAVPLVLCLRHPVRPALVLAGGPDTLAAGPWVELGRSRAHRAGRAQPDLRLHAGRASHARGVQRIGLRSSPTGDTIDALS